MSVVAGSRPSDRAGRPPKVPAREPARTPDRGDRPTRESVQPTLRRLHRFGVRPDRDLGQNFLIDSNILGVIGRAAELGSGDIVLEIGGGLGVLSEYLAARVAYVHVVEVDRRLRDALHDATEPYTNVALHWGDAMTIDLCGLDPEPTKLVANLPYGIAAGALLRTIEELASVGSWVAMMQREVGERLAAAPGDGAYGAPSVIAQLACEVEVLRTIPRTVFQPTPNVDSVLVRLRRRPATSDAGASAGAAVRSTSSAALRGLVGGAFAHRRKTLARSLALSGSATGCSPQQVREALERLGHPANARAERLSPEDFRGLARLLGL
jgi:16S rRNA (adenine1518-N6/adenine1519-N6)-dimethyltransferase